jgi:hypothetical protein
MPKRELNKRLTLDKLIHKLEKIRRTLPGDTLVDIEGCDCIRTASGVEADAGRVFIRSEQWRE